MILVRAVPVKYSSRERLSCSPAILRTSPPVTKELMRQVLCAHTTQAMEKMLLVDAMARKWKKLPVCTRASDVLVVHMMSCLNACVRRYLLVLSSGMAVEVTTMPSGTPVTLDVVVDAWAWLVAAECARL